MAYLILVPPLRYPNIYATTKSFAPPNLSGGQSGGLGPYLLHDGLEYALDYEHAVRFAREQGQPVFLDFTGINCINCRKMEQKVLPKPQVRERLEKFVRVQVFTDQIPLLEDEADRNWLAAMDRVAHVLGLEE